MTSEAHPLFEQMRSRVAQRRWIRGVEDDRPFSSPFFRRQFELHRLTVRIEHQKKTVIGNSRPGAIMLGDRVSIQERSERLRVAYVPVAGAHLGAVGPEPFQILRPIALERDASEPSPAPKDRMLATKLDQSPRKIDQRLVSVLPIDP